MQQIKERQSEIGEVLLLLVGEFYEDEQKYRQRARELNLEACIRFVADYIPNEEEFAAKVKIEKRKYSWDALVEAIEGFFSLRGFSRSL